MKQVCARRAARPLTVALVAVALIAAACGGDDDDSPASSAPVESQPTDPVEDARARVAEAESAVAAATDDFDAARSQACGDAEEYVTALDRYGKLFTDGVATVGDVREAGADLVEPREDVADAIDGVTDARDALAAAQQELVDATAALDAAVAVASSVPTTPATAPAVTTTTLVPPATIERVEQAESDLEEAGGGITDETPLTEATVEYNSAAFALEIAWGQALVQAGCLDADRQAEALQQVGAYTSALQTQLRDAGYDPGEIDGIYGPKTVAAVKQLQADSGLRETGYVDRATAAALDDQLAAVQAEVAADAMTQTVAVQTVLTVTGFWTGPVDGEWTDELTQALMAFQAELEVPQTGEVDTATLAAFQQRLAALGAAIDASTSTTQPPPATTTPPSSAPATTSAP